MAKAPVETLVVLTTGGTLDKEYDLDSQMVIGKPQVHNILARVISDINFDIRPVLALDSLDMTDADRAELVQALDAVSSDKVLITHGTDSMALTARFLLAHAKLGQKVVVLCGSIQPALMRDSDADFNLGAAVAAVQLLEPGVYICMSGRILPAQTVHKDRSRGIFYQE